MNKFISIKEVEDNNGRRNHKSPDAFRTISEVASELSVPLHVLRFWETKFSQLRPMKRAGGRRYYRPEDIALLKKIQQRKSTTTTKAENGDKKETNRKKRQNKKHR